MKQIILAAVLFSMFFYSCQNKNPDSSATDSLSIDSSNALQTTLDTAVAPTEAEIIAAEDQGQDNLNPEDFDYTYEGLINNQLKVRVNIFKFNGEQKARAVYLNSKKIINMEAVYPAVGTFELTEKIEDKSTGIWKIAVEEEDIMTGTWNSPDGKKQMPVSLSMTEGDFDDFLPKEKVKTGFYELREMNEDEETKKEFPVLYSEALYVKNMAGNTLYFDLYIQGSPPGVHIGTVNGFAVQSGNDYVYKNEEGCEITMSFSENAVALSQKGTDINCGFGANIGAFGTLKKR